MSVQLPSEKQFAMDSAVVLVGLCATFIIVFGVLAGIQSASPTIVKYIGAPIGESKKEK